jgi:hypothetical protein
MLFVSMVVRVILFLDKLVAGAALPFLCASKAAKMLIITAPNVNTTLALIKACKDLFSIFA